MATEDKNGNFHSESNGRFVNKYGGSEYRQNTNYSIILSSKQEFKEYPKKANGFANKERKNTKHHIEHAKAMGFKNQNDYEQAAIKFFNGNQGKLYFSPVRNRWYRYDEQKEILCVSSNGIIHTFNKYSNKKFDKIKRQDQLNEK